jgi:hypothetical protein
MGAIKGRFCRITADPDRLGDPGPAAEAAGAPWPRSRRRRR